MAVNFLPIERVRNFSKHDFETAILRDRPVIVEDAVQGWNACASWTPDYLTKKIGDLRIGVRTSSTHFHPDFERMRAEWNRPLLLRLLGHLGRRIIGRGRTDDGEQMAFGQLLKLLTTSPEAYRYLAGAEELGILREGVWNDAFAELRADYDVPAYVPQSRLDSAALWVSAKGVRSHLHYDGNCLHNLNAQVAGSKQVQLYSPELMGQVYPYLHSNGHPYTFSQVNVEDVDHHQFPRFSELEGYEGTLKAGDLLFIPAYWYHTFKHLGDFNVNVNFWWRADFVRLTPVSARDYFGGLAFDVLAESKIPPIWLTGWFRKMERRLTQVR
ncbi:cupin-like domain-containing protein [Janthinobacterium sp. SUN211]|uniref:cupin-like domain-containing protein n=1 Tax=unclassified Janthinobacterium TaxID=2610881 RepID=UPI0027124287|nr:MULTISPECIES: cupin-like domain-containing protein [unclassified Janthinobacterium]MDO8043087.1 cupin-like domain-containing protein [Janthinobacterium sp. SUN137]MDO8052396.1 cupin-like domain-containing protein [Janthinobacterium sp. SUN211]